VHSHQIVTPQKPKRGSCKEILTKPVPKKEHPSQTFLTRVKDEAFIKWMYARKTFLSYFLVLLHGENLTQCVTVSAKIPKQLKEKMQRLKIKPSKILRKALEDEVQRREMQELKEEINKLKPILDKVDMDDIVKSIREDRDNR
jgi:hypothetical protein